MSHPPWFHGASHQKEIPNGLNFILILCTGQLVQDIWWLTDWLTGKQVHTYIHTYIDSEQLTILSYVFKWYKCALLTTSSPAIERNSYHHAACCQNGTTSSFLEIEAVEAWFHCGCVILPPHAPDDAMSRQHSSLMSSVSDDHETTFFHPDRNNCRNVATLSICDFTSSKTNSWKKKQ